MGDNEALAKKLGIPLRIAITNEIRTPGCIAMMAILDSVEGEYAVYKGECPERHMYQAQHEFRKKISELRVQLSITNGDLGSDTAQSHQIRELEEY